jgi:galactonate dehydratase
MKLLRVFLQIKSNSMVSMLRDRCAPQPLTLNSFNLLGGRFYVAKRSPVPIACGEVYYSREQFAELLKHNAVHIIQLEPQFLGISASKQICGMVHAHNGVIAPHSAQGPVCSVVCSHLNMATPNFYLHEIFDEFNEPWEEKVLVPPIKVKDGFLEPPEAPGLGVELNLEEAKRHPYHVGNWLPLFRQGWEKREANQ